MGIKNISGRRNARNAQKAASTLQRMSSFQNTQQMLEEFRTLYGQTNAALPMTGTGEESSGFQNTKGSMLTQIQANLMTAALAGQTYDYMRRQAAKASKKQGQLKTGIAIAGMVAGGVATAMAPAAGAAAATGVTGASPAAAAFNASAQIPSWMNIAQGASTGLQLGMQFNDAYSSFFDNNRDLIDAN